MIEDDVMTIMDLFINFKLKISLPRKLSSFEISDEFLKSNFRKKGNNYIFNLDNVILIINPNDRIKTIQKKIKKDNKIISQIIAGYDNIEYLN